LSGVRGGDGAEGDDTAKHAKPGPSNMRSKRCGFFEIVVVLGLLAGGAARAACPSDVATLAPGTWCEVPNSKLRAVAFNWPVGVEYTQNGIGVRGVIDLWSGGAYDTKRNRLIVWGGGHAGYAGNELYAFDVNSLSWSRVNDPSIPIAYNAAYAPDGAPGARHTYESLEYVPSLDRFCSFIGGSDYPTGNDRGKGQLNCFDFDSNRWERKAETPGGAAIDDTIGVKAAYDPVSGRVFVLGGPRGPFASYNPAANDWSIHLSSNSWIPYHATTALDPQRRKMVFVGNGDQQLVDLNSPAADPLKLNASGGAAIVNGNGPGLDYDPVSDRIVGWAGGTDVYALNLSNLTWTLLPAAATNTTTPTAPNTNGTYGRFRYIPAKNVFVVVNSIDENVYFYKLSTGGGIAPPAAPAKPTVILR
jgi:hypothetical protein